MRKKYTIFVALLLVVISLSIGIDSVVADAYHNDLKTELATKYSFKTTNYSTSNAFRVGVKGWSSGTPYKGINSASNMNAYCISMNHKVGFTNGTSYNTKNGKAFCSNKFTGSITNGAYILAGYIVEAINSDSSIKASDATMFVGNGSGTKKITTEKDCSNAKGCDWDNRKEYAYFAYKVVTLNTFFSRRGVAGSVDFTKVNSKEARFGRTNDSEGKELAKKIEDYIDKAKKKYEEEYTSSNSKASISYTKPSTTLIKSGSFYITSTTFKNNTVTKLTNGTAVSTKASGSAPNGATVYFCTDKKGANCSKSVDDDKAYYIKVIPGSSSLNGSKVTITVSATASFNYPKLLMYCRTKDTSNQAIAVHGVYKYDASNSKKFELSIPKDSNKTIEVSKSDSDGETLTGANFTLLDDSGKSYALTPSEDGRTFSYTTSDPAIDFSKLKFTLKETITPDGYITHSDIENITVGNNEVKYYKKVEGDSDDTEITEDQYNSSYVCKVTTTTTTTVTTGGVPGEPSVQEQIDYKATEEDSCDSYNQESKSDSTTDQEVVTKVDTKTDVSKICVIKGEEVVNNNKIEDNSIISDEYCNKEDIYKLESNGNHVFIELLNRLNSVKISKVDATNSKEVVGAELKICKKSDYEDEKIGINCTPAKTVNNTEMSWTSGSTEKELTGVPVGSYYIIETVPPLGYKLATTVTPFSIDEAGVVKTGKTTATDNMIVVDNALNEVTISKTDIVTSKELPGASLSICESTLKSVNNDSEESSDDESEDEVTDEEVSDKGDLEEEPVEDESGDEEITDSTNPSDYTLVTDEVGDCVPVNLQDGSGPATWVSGDKPHTIKGLPAGTYYLVETTAPNGYTTSESILFRMNDNGTLTDVTGKPLQDNKIVMKDKPIEDVKTGSRFIIIVALIGIGSIMLGGYYAMVSGKVALAGVGDLTGKRIRKRKIHK